MHGGIADSEPEVTFGHAASVLDAYGIAYLHVIEPRIKGDYTLHEGRPPVAVASLRPFFSRPIIAAGGFDREGEEVIVETGDADLVAFDRRFTSKPRSALWAGAQAAAGALYARCLLRRGAGPISKGVTSALFERIAGAAGWAMKGTWTSPGFLLGAGREARGADRASQGEMVKRALTDPECKSARRKTVDACLPEAPALTRDVSVKFHRDDV